MIIQLPCGRFIECSLEQYLSLSDDELSELNGLPVSYTKEYSNPFYSSFVSHKAEKIVEEEEEEVPEEDVDMINKEEKRSDKYFHPDDI